MTCPGASGGRRAAQRRTARPGRLHCPGCGRGPPDGARIGQAGRSSCGSLLYALTCKERQTPTRPRRPDQRIRTSRLKPQVNADSRVLAPHRPESLDNAIEIPSPRDRSLLETLRHTRDLPRPADTANHPSSLTNIRASAPLHHLPAELLCVRRL
ncbi:hypothetical protein FRAHR75_820004 [Frankia sp. Hr75.2]|nr:hypothetical protein FRAHR75_820004 [Frankia sp. Hr75.2]